MKAWLLSRKVRHPLASAAFFGLAVLHAQHFVTPIHVSVPDDGTAIRRDAMTFSGVFVKPGDKVQIVITGTASPGTGPGFEFPDADGVPDSPISGGLGGFPLIEEDALANVYSVIFQIVPEGEVPDEESKWSPAGTHVEFEATTEGELVFLYHDTLYRPSNWQAAYADNQGGFQADITGGRCALCARCEQGDGNCGVDEDGDATADWTLGEDENGDSVGRLYFEIDEPEGPTASLSHLRVTTRMPEGVVRQGGVIRQVRSPAGLIDVQSGDPGTTGYQMRFFHDDQIGPPDEFGLYPIPEGAVPHTTWAVENPNGDNNILRVTKTTVKGSEVNQFEWTGGDDKTLQLVTGNGLRKERRWSVADQSTGDRIETVEVRNQDNSLAYVEQNRFHQFAWGELQIERIVDPEGAALTETWTYYEDPDDAANYQHTQMHIDSRGRWIRYEYDSVGRVIKQVSQFLDAPPDAGESASRVLTTIYSSSEPQVTEIETLLGHEISRRYTIQRADETMDIQCAVPAAAWDDPLNLVTVRKLYREGAFAGELASIENPDGTMSLYSYSPDSEGGKTTEVKTGEPNAGSTDIVNGTRTITVVDKAGNHLSEQVYDIPASDVLLASAETTDQDDFGRPTRIDYLDGTFTKTVYGCCGVERQTDREGIVTEYEYDDLKRVTLTRRAGITTRNVYDAEGRLLDTYRKGIKDGNETPEIHTNHSSYDLAGRLTASTDALDHTTHYVEDTEDDTGHTIRTTTLPEDDRYPDGSIRIEEFYQDGSLLSVGGTAAHPLKYEYGVDADFGRWTKAIRLGEGGAETEWSKTYTDMLGRAHRTETAAGAITRSFYNAKGQLEKQVDPDGVTTLFAYDSEGELETTAIDMNQDGVIDYDGQDRITRNANTVVPDAREVEGEAIDVRRTTTRIWSINNLNVSRVIAVLDVSTDGLDSWNTINGLTTHSRTDYDRPNARRTVTTTAPDGTENVQTFEQGRLVYSVTEHAELSSPILSSVTLMYDAHGRQETATDARGIVTTSTYDDADRLTSTTIEGPGEVPQTTSFEYDNLNRRIKTVLPDSTPENPKEVEYHYYATGELKLTFGARTYPVEYTYDPQGRMKTLTTWQHFDENPDARQAAAVTTWNYHSASGFMTSKRYDDEKGPDYTYTLAGRLKTRLWARLYNGERLKTEYDYNDAGDLESVDYADTTPDVSYAYDRRGRLSETTTTFESEPAVFRVEYNNADQPISETWEGGPLDGVIVARDYDSLLRLENVSSTLDSELLSSAAYTYDPASRMATVTDTSGANIATYAYLPNSLLMDSLTFKNAGETRMTTTKTWDGLSRLESINNVLVGGTVVSSHNYLYNQANQRSKATLADGSYWEYEYDHLGQVTSGKHYWSDGAPVAGQQFEYTYDDIGNRETTEAGGNPDGGGLRGSLYTANLLNQYEQRTVPGAVDIVGTAHAQATVTINNQAVIRQGEYFWKEFEVPNATTAAYPEAKLVGVRNNAGSQGEDAVTEQEGHLFVPESPELFPHDEDGNLKSDGRWIYTWDGENRLVALEAHSDALGSGVPRLRLVFTYDSQSRRTTKQALHWDTDHWSLSADLHFIYDGWNLIAELNANNVSMRTYDWGQDLSGTIQGAGGVGGLLAVSESDGTTHFSAFDGNGNVMTLVHGATAAVSAEYEYAPFGVLLRMTAPIATGTPFQFSTKYRDDETGLLYYGYRYSQPSVGRWIGRDVLQENGGVNLYAFANNNAPNSIDPLGQRVYLVYREFNKIPLSPYLYYFVGHVYLAFDDTCVDSSKWAEAVKAGSGNVLFPDAETFSFHPRQLDRNDSRRNDVPHFGTLYTEGSFVFHNDDTDRQAFRDARFGGGVIPGALRARLFPVDTTEEQQIKLYESAVASRITNNGDSAPRKPDPGPYSLGDCNCGRWATDMVKAAGVPLPRGVSGLNLGVGVGGWGDWILLPQAITGAAEFITRTGISTGMHDAIRSGPRFEVIYPDVSPRPLGGHERQLGAPGIVWNGRF